MISHIARRKLYAMKMTRIIEDIYATSTGMLKTQVFIVFIQWPIKLLISPRAWINNPLHLAIQQPYTYSADVRACAKFHGKQKKFFQVVLKAFCYKYLINAAVYLSLFMFVSPKKSHLSNSGYKKNFSYRPTSSVKLNSRALRPVILSRHSFSCDIFPNCSKIARRCCSLTSIGN